MRLSADLPSRTQAAPSFDEQIARFDRFSHALVILEEQRLVAVLEELRRFRQALADHLALFQDLERGTGRDGVAGELYADHERFQLSVEELRWFDAILSNDDHGGHRQACGQYGKILAESLRQHRLRERFASSPTVGPVRSSPTVPSEQP